MIKKIEAIMKKTRPEAHELHKYIGQETEVHGAVHKIREMSGFAFVILRTKRTLLQCIYIPGCCEFPLSDLRENMSVVIRGEVVEDPRSKAGFELRIRAIKVLSAPDGELPVAINGKEIPASLDTLLDLRPVTARNEKERAVFQIQAGICRGFRSFLEKGGFTEIHSPKIVSMGAEGGANIFKLDYFGKEAFLCQSPQLYKQMMVGVFERVYEIAPVFRAERHHTSRHINEYTSVDVELGFIESFYDIMKLEAQMLSHCLSFLGEHYADELALLGASLPAISEIPSLTFTQAKELVSRTYKRPITDQSDFEPEEERLLSEIIRQETGCEFVFVTHYKSSKRPFYAMDSPEDPCVTESFDLLFRGLEITTGGQRIHDYNQQLKKMRSLGIETRPFESYLMAHRCGLPPHGGFGLGLERFTARLLGFQNIRRATLFPRDMNRLEP
ncbi:MAG: aspartate--tRNA(Asn) ligase [Christensenellales bacterium]